MPISAGDTGHVAEHNRLAIGPDSPAAFTAVYGADLGYDYEFDATSTSLPSGWSWVNQGSATYSESFGAGVISHPGPAGATDDNKAIVRSLPTPTSWAATAKVRVVSKDTNFFSAGLCLQESSSGKLVTFSVARTGRTVDSDKWTNPTTFSASLAAAFTVHDTCCYLRLTRNADATYTHEVSPDGAAWFTVAASSSVASFMTPDQLGVFALRNGATPVAAAVHWFRVR